MGKIWREMILSEKAFSGHQFPEEGRWFIEFAKARQLERIDPVQAQRHLITALERATVEEDRLSLMASHCDHCLCSGLELPHEHLETLIAALRRGGLERESAIDKLYVCCLWLVELGDVERLLEMAARLCDMSLSPPTEEEIRDLLLIEESERQSQGPLIEVLREGEAPAKTLQIQRGRFWFSGFEILANVVVSCADLIADAPWDWAFLQPRFGEWLDQYEEFMDRHMLSTGEDVAALRRILRPLE